jgi:hypothetical protein
MVVYLLFEYIPGDNNNIAFIHSVSEARKVHDTIILIMKLAGKHLQNFLINQYY